MTIIKLMSDPPYTWVPHSTRQMNGDRGPGCGKKSHGKLIPKQKLLKEQGITAELDRLTIEEAEEEVDDTPRGYTSHITHSPECILLPKTVLVKGTCSER